MVQARSSLWRDRMALNSVPNPSSRDGEARQVGADLVVGEHRRNRRHQADRGGEQRLGDARRDHREVGVVHRRDRREAVHDAPHRAEQPDERGGGADRGEEDHPALQPVHLALHGHGDRAVDPLPHPGAGRCRRRRPGPSAAIRPSPRRTPRPSGAPAGSPSASYSSSRLPPDQNRSSNPSASWLTRRRLDHFSNTTAQTQTLAPSRPMHDDLHDDVGLQEQAPERQIAPGRPQVHRIDSAIHRVLPCSPRRPGRLRCSAGRRRRLQALQRLPPRRRNARRAAGVGTHAGKLDLPPRRTTPSAPTTSWRSLTEAAPSAR